MEIFILFNFISVQQDLDKIDEYSHRPACVACLMTTPTMPDRIIQGTFVVSFG